MVCVTRPYTFSCNPVIALRSFLLRATLYSVPTPEFGPLFSDLLLRLLPRDQFVFPALDLRFRFVVSLGSENVLEFFEFFDHPLVLLDAQDDAHALTILVHDIAGLLQSISLSL